VHEADELMAAVGRRDSAAFEALFNRYNQLVFGMAIKMLGDRVAAEDATQAVFLKIWHAPELFRGGNLPAWLVCVTRNRCLDQIRSSRPHYPMDAANLMAEDASLEETAFEKIDATKVRKAVEGLPNEQRAPIQMGFFGGLTHEEIAARTGVPLGTVKTRIRAGLHKLRDRLDGAVNR
jgi:RNA polymerase sigma-70 factor (ECF subfamily)